MAKFRVAAEFYCYIDNEGMQKHVLKPEDLDVEEPEEEDDQGKLELQPDDHVAEDGVACGDVFAVNYGESDPAKLHDYFKIEEFRGESLSCRSAKTDATYIYTQEEIQGKIERKEWQRSIQARYDLMASGETEETEAPVTADGTTVEDAVKKAVSNLMGHLDRPLRLSGTNTGIWSGRELAGDLEIPKQAAHDLLDAEADGLRAIFVLTLEDKK